jgi:hypothetical protein
MNDNYSNFSAMRVGLASSSALAVLTLITFGLAMMAIPPSGPYCPANCMDYPYPDILSYYPRDYYWMVAALFQLSAFLVLVISHHFIAAMEKKVFSLMAVVSAAMSATILMVDYYLQLAVVPISVMKGETAGISLLTQYNGHGIFLALEELGYILMSISLFCLSPVFGLNNSLEKAIRWILVLPFAGNLIAFAYYSARFGLDRDYRFEVASITINWTVLIFFSILLSVHLKQKMKALPK